LKTLRGRPVVPAALHRAGFFGSTTPPLSGPRTDQKGDVIEWLRFDVKTGKPQPFFDRAAFTKALGEAGVSDDYAKGAAKSKSQNFDAKKNVIVIEADNDLFLYSLTKQAAAAIYRGSRKTCRSDSTSFRFDISVHHEPDHMESLFVPVRDSVEVPEVMRLNHASRSSRMMSVRKSRNVHLRSRTRARRGVAFDGL